MKVIEDLILWIQGAVVRGADVPFDDLNILSMKRKGKNKLVLELGPDAEITIHFKVNGTKVRCPTCGKTRPGWPFWWRNIAEGKGLTYACRDCVQAARLYKSEGETNKPEG